MKTKNGAEGDAGVVIEGQEPLEIDRFFLDFRPSEVEADIYLKGPARLTRKLTVLLALNSGHLPFGKVTAKYVVSDGEAYEYLYEPFEGGVGTFIDKTSKKAIAVLNMKMRVTPPDPGAPHPEITVHSWFNLVNSQ